MDEVQILVLNLSIKKYRFENR